MTFTRNLALLLVLVGGSVERAEAYIDPGAASIALQSIIGAVAVAFVLVRRWGATLRKLLRRLFVRRHSDAFPQRKG